MQTIRGFINYPPRPHKAEPKKPRMYVTERTSKGNADRGRPWATDDDKYLLSQIDAGVSKEVVAAILGRTVGSVSHRNAYLRYRKDQPLACR